MVDAPDKHTRRAAEPPDPEPRGPEAPGDAALRQATAERERYRDLFDGAPMAYVLLDMAGRIRLINEKACALFGGAPETLEGVSFVGLVKREDRASFLLHLHEARRGPSSALVCCSAGRGGATFMASLESTSALDARGALSYRLAIIDQTERLREERERDAVNRERERSRAEAAEGQRRAARVLAASAELAESLDLETAIGRAAQIPVPSLADYCAVDLVDAAGEVRRQGFSRADGMADLLLDPYAPLGSAATVRSGEPRIVPSCAAGDVLGLTLHPASYAMLAARVGAYLCLPLRAHGQILGALVLVRGPGSRFEPEDVALAVELARSAALAIDNARLYQDASDADRRKDEFLAMLGHELRNPLAAVTFAVACMKRYTLDPGVSRTAAVIERQSARLARLVDDLLDTSRITRGKISLRREPVSLGAAMARAVESTRALFDERGHTLLVAPPSPDITLTADPTRLDQVLTNLLVNAAKYTPPGGHVELECSRAGGDAVLRLRDDGAGIPREMLGRIFAPFAQLGASPDRTDRGLGIGLTLARSLVELHGGKLTAHSEGPGKGSEFTVRLPLEAPVEEGALEVDGVSPELEGSALPFLTPEAAPPSLPPSASPARARPSLASPSLLEASPAAPSAGAEGPASSPEDERSRRVLVVEDNPDVAAMLRAELEAEGHVVTVAYDGNEGLAAALAGTHDLMFIDLGLPGMDGVELAERLRDEPARKGARLVALTGYGGAETARRCRQAGFDAHFTKPIAPDDLERLLMSPRRP